MGPMIRRMHLGDEASLGYLLPQVGVHTLI